MNCQDSGISNHHNLTSNPGTIPPTPDLWFHIPWVSLIIMPLIMVMLRFTLQRFQLNLTLNLFQIHTPLQLNKLMTMKWTISWNYSTQNMMKIFWMLTSICLRLDWWSPLLQNFIQSLLCFFINTEERMLQSQIEYFTFLYLSQPTPL